MFLRSSATGARVQGFHGLLNDAGTPGSAVKLQGRKSFMLFIVTAVKLLAEVALLSLIGRWLLGAWLTRLNPGQTAGNPFLWVLTTLSAPPVWLVARLTSRWVHSRHHLKMALGLTALVWILATFLKIRFCVDAGMELCR